MTAGHRTPFSATRTLGQRLNERSSDYDALLEMAAGKRFVLLGEATHGTHEFYRMRAEITRRLVQELDFDAVAVEGDWPDAWRVNRFASGRTQDDAVSALGDFERFPTWMWRNREVIDFIGWLRNHNAALQPALHTAFCGLDLYSLYRSAEHVVHYLQDVDPERVETARERYAALDHVRDPQTYGYEAALKLRPRAEAAVARQLQELRERAVHYLQADGLQAREAQFAAERNATAVVNAEAYYRSMFGSRVNSWNLRDAHMRDTLFALARHRAELGRVGRVVVWAHNSHLGDARATEMGRQGEWNLGQLVRESVGAAALLVGFTTYTGKVCAASRWGGDVEHKQIRPAMAGSYEHLFHTSRLDRFFLPMKGAAAEPLRECLLERAIGVIYLPQSERSSHYFEASIAAQFDAVFHLDETRAVEPLDTPDNWRRHEETETFPFGL